MRAVDEALALDDEAEEERNRLKAGQVAELQHKEQQGDKVAEASQTGRSCTTLTIHRPEPKGPPGKVSRPRGPLPAQEGIIDPKDAMSAYMTRKIDSDERDGVRLDKKMKLEEEKFELEKVTAVAAKADAQARWLGEVARDDKKIAVEQARLQAESQHNTDKLAVEKDRLQIDKEFNNAKLQADTKRHDDAHQLAMLREQNRAKEAADASKAAAAQTAMMMQLIQSLAANNADK
ncbi:unnamed protein product [Ectocarpus fasciculatus]